MPKHGYAYWFVLVPLVIGAGVSAASVRAQQGSDDGQGSTLEDRQEKLKSPTPKVRETKDEDGRSGRDDASRTLSGSASPKVEDDRRPSGEEKLRGRQQACAVRQADIKRHLNQLITVATARQQKYEEVAGKVTTFYAEKLEPKGVSAPDPALKLAIATRAEELKSTIEKVQGHAETFSCDTGDPKESLAGALADAKELRSAVREMRDAVKRYAKAVRNAAEQSLGTPSPSASPASEASSPASNQGQ